VQDKANNLSPKVVTLKGKYELSKRTYLYGMLAGYNKAAAGTFLQGYATTLGSAGTSATNFALGVVHGF